MTLKLPRTCICFAFRIKCLVSGLELESERTSASDLHSGWFAIVYFCRHIHSNRVEFLQTFLPFCPLQRRYAFTWLSRYQVNASKMNHKLENCDKHHWKQSQTTQIWRIFARLGWFWDWFPGVFHQVSEFKLNLTPVWGFSRKHQIVVTFIPIVPRKICSRTLKTDHNIYTLQSFTTLTSCVPARREKEEVEACTNIRRVVVFWSPAKVAKSRYDLRWPTVTWSDLLGGYCVLLIDLPSTWLESTDWVDNTWETPNCISM